MAFLPGSSGLPTSGSWLHRWWERRTPNAATFVCGVRVLDGAVPGEGRHWRFRTSAVDPLVTSGVVTLNHGSRSSLRLRPDSEPSTGSAGRPGHVLLGAQECGSGARLLLSVPLGELERFGRDPL